MTENVEQKGQFARDTRKALERQNELLERIAVALEKLAARTPNEP